MEAITPTLRPELADCVAAMKASGSRERNAVVYDLAGHLGSADETVAEPARAELGRLLDLPLKAAADIYAARMAAYSLTGDKAHGERARALLVRCDTLLGVRRG
jgi:hypothetical protein